MSRPLPAAAPWGARWGPALLALGVPVWLLSRAEGRALGPFSVDLAGHLWMGWSASRGPDLYSRWIGHPEGVDLLPVLGGWLDVVLVGWVAPWTGLVLAYNLVIALYVAVVGWGGARLARALGAAPWAAALGGALLQLDSFVLMHLAGGRPEQVGLGFAALALGLALQVWRGQAPPWQAAVAGALLLGVSWELSLLVALSLAWMLPWLPRAELPPGAARRWLRAAAGCAALAGPWVLLFLVRAGGVRALDEGDFAARTAHRASVGLLGWFGLDSVRPPTLALLALLLVPLCAPARDRRLWVGVGLGLLLTLVLATGPAPGLWTPGALPGPAWAPFRWLQAAPVLGWFHWPDRLLCVWSLACAGAVALGLTRLGSAPAAASAWTRRVLPVGVALAALWGDVRATLERQGLPPRGEFELPARRAAVLLGERPEPGAVLDLPIQPDRAQHLAYQLEQLAHGRPILFNMVLTHLADPGLEALVAEEPLLAWFAALMEPTRPAPRTFGAAELAGLRGRGFAFVVLHRRGWPAARWRQGREALESSLGAPILQDREDWICWALAAPEP